MFNKLYNSMFTSGLRIMRIIGISFLTGSVVAVSSCKKEGSDDTLMNLGLLAALSNGKTQEVQISFDTADNTLSSGAFNCSGQVTLKNYTMNPKDLRFYISNVRMVKENGTEVPVTLNDDGEWQYSNVALLDFEDASGTCNDTLSGGTTATNTSISGKVPAGTYTGIAFDVGLPEDLNSQDNATAPAPLNISSMYWSWTGGFKFMKLEMIETGSSIQTSFHPGSTSCSDYVSGGTAGAQNCAEANRPSILLNSSTEIDTTSVTVVLDLNNLFQRFEADLAMNTMCMPGADKDNCLNVLENMGLAANGTSTPAANSFLLR